MRSGLSSDIEVNPPNDIKTNPPFSGVELGFWRQATACHVARPESLLKFLCNSYTVCNTDYFDSFGNCFASTNGSMESVSIRQVPGCSTAALPGR